MADLRPRHVAHALGVPGTTLATWFRRGICPAFSKTPAGEHRRMSWLDLVHAATTREVAAYGAPIEDAARISFKALCELNEEETFSADSRVFFWKTPQGWEGGAKVPDDVGSYGSVWIGAIARRIHERLPEEHATRLATIAARYSHAC